MNNLIDIANQLMASSIPSKHYVGVTVRNHIVTAEATIYSLHRERDQMAETVKQWASMTGIINDAYAIGSITGRDRENLYVASKRWMEDVTEQVKQLVREEREICIHY